MKPGFFALISAAIALGFPASGHAQQGPCGNRDEIVDRLSARYGEAREKFGLAHNNGLLEVFSSPDTGTWTIILTSPSGTSCLIAAGDYWEDAPAGLMGSGQPT